MAVGKGGVVEYTPETVFGTWPTATMSWIGLVQKFQAPTKKPYEEIRALKAAGATDKLQIHSCIGHQEELYEKDLEYIPQDWTFFRYAMNDTGGTGLTDTLKSLSIGEILTKSGTTYWRKNLGSVLDTAKFSVQRGKKALVTHKVSIADVVRTAYDPWATSTYNTSATASSAAAFKWSDLTDIDMPSGTNLGASVDKFEFEIKNNLEPTYDPMGTLNTKVTSIDPDKRDISLTLSVRHSSINWLVKKVLEFAADGVVVTFGGKTLTFTGARIPEEPFELAPTGFQTADLKFVGITNLTISA